MFHGTLDTDKMFHGTLDTDKMFHGTKADVFRINGQHRYRREKSISLMQSLVENHT